MAMSNLSSPRGYPGASDICELRHPRRNDVGLWPEAGVAALRINSDVLIWRRWRATFAAIACRPPPTMEQAGDSLYEHGRALDDLPDGYISPAVSATNDWRRVISPAKIMSWRSSMLAGKPEDNRWPTARCGH
jgi:hypothetical protein